MMPALANGSAEKPESLPLQSESTSEIDFFLGSSSKLAATENPKSSKSAFEEFGVALTTNKHKSSTDGTKVGGSSALDLLMKEQEMAKERINRKDYWLCEGIIGKVMSKGFADKVFSISDGPTFNGSALPRIDSLEVYGRAKDEFHWKEKMDVALNMEAHVLDYGPGIADVEKKCRSMQTAPVQEQVVADGLRLPSKFYSLCKKFCQN